MEDEMGALYRLPDWLGGRVVEFIATDGFRTEVKIDGHNIEVPVGLLTKVIPPSITDPEPLPLSIKSGVGLQNWLRLTSEGTEAAATLEVGYFTKSFAIWLQAGELRRLARAAWQRANEVEAIS